MKRSYDLQKSYLMFLVGTFISSVGSLSFGITCSAAMLLSGYSLLNIGIFATVSRFSGLIAVFLLGEKTDYWNARKLIVITEAIGFLAAIGLAFCWSRGKDYYFVFLIFASVRSFVLGIQGPSRAKISKIFACSDFQSQSRSAIWLNKVTHGAILFAAALGWIFIKYFDLYAAIFFDMISFIINGVITWNYISNEATSPPPSPVALLNKFKLLYRYVPQVAILDLLLAISLCGINTFYVRLAGMDSSLVPLFHLIYGVAVWATGFVFRIPKFHALHGPYWIFRFRFILS